MELVYVMNGFERARKEWAYVYYENHQRVND
jgi:hypothetical protein